MVGDCDLAAPSLIEAMVVFCHGAQPHAGHSLAITVDGLPLGGAGSTRLRVECLHPGCGGSSEWAGLPVSLVGVAALDHHARHEGHPSRFLVDGKLYNPITSKEPA